MKSGYVKEELSFVKIHKLPPQVADKNANTGF